MATYKGIQGYSVQKLSSDPTASEAEGQLWYNSGGKFKLGTTGTGAWASGTSIYPAIYTGGMYCGTQTAGIYGGGLPGVLTTSFTYNGSSWTEGAPTMGTGRSNNNNLKDAELKRQQWLLGEKHLVLLSRSPDTEWFNGTSWTEKANLANERYARCSSIGTQAGAKSVLVEISHPLVISTLVEYMGWKCLVNWNSSTPGYESDAMRWRNFYLRNANWRSSGPTTNISYG